MLDFRSKTSSDNRDVQMGDSNNPDQKYTQHIYIYILVVDKNQSK